MLEDAVTFESLCEGRTAATYHERVKHAQRRIEFPETVAERAAETFKTRIEKQNALVN